MKVELPEFLLELAKQVNEQPNRGTAHPFYEVRCKRFLVTEEGYNESHWELHSEDSEGYPTYSTKPYCDNNAALEDFEDENKKWCDEWIEENVDPECIGEDSSFNDFFDFEEHKNYGGEWPEGFRVIHLQEYEETVSTHLTLADANWFIKRKQHDYPDLYTYAVSAYWSPQIKQLQDWLKSLCNENKSK